MTLALAHPQLADTRILGNLDEQQRRLLAFNRQRLSPGCIADDWRERLEQDHRILVAEGEFIEAERRRIRPFVENVPKASDAFIQWFENLRATGPGQGDLLFPWLAESASLSDMRWFLSQEVAGEAGFDDLVSLSQIKLPDRPKLEMARNYWDEMGRGNEKGMHGPMLARLARYFEIAASSTEIVAESIALGNLMIGLAANRRYAFQGIGALGVIELTAPTRAIFVEQGLRRLGVRADARQYFAVHAILDIEHSKAWNSEVLAPLVEEDGRRARWLAEGAMMRLVAGQRCFTRYRSHLWTSSF